MKGGGVEIPNLIKHFDQAVIEFEKSIGVPLSGYMKQVVATSKQEILSRDNWSSEPGSIYAGMGYTVSGNKGQLTNDAPHAYLRQWGETESGATIIQAKDKKLFINKTGLKSEEFKALSNQEIRERFQYGVDYFFANFVRIASNPYIAIPGISDEARNKMAGATQNEVKSERIFDTFVDSLFTMIGNIFNRLNK